MRERRVPDFFGGNSNGNGKVEQGGQDEVRVGKAGIENTSPIENSVPEVDSTSAPYYGHYDSSGYQSHRQLQQSSLERNSGTDAQGFYNVYQPMPRKIKKGKFSLAATVIVSSVGVAFALIVQFILGAGRWLLNNSDPENSIITVNGRELHGEEAEQAIQSMDHILMMSQIISPVVILLLFVAPFVLLYVTSNKKSTNR